MNFFNGPTFTDPTNQKPSFVRRSLAWLLLFGAVLVFGGMAHFWFASLETAKEVASYVIKVLAALATIIGVAYGAMQGAKGYAQGQAAKPPPAIAPPATTVTPTPNPPPTPATAGAATGSTTTAMGDSTKVVP